MPTVIGIAAGIELRAAVEALGEDAELQVGLRTCAPPHLPDEAIDRTAAIEIHHAALSVTGFLRDDVDNAVNGVRSPDGAARTADDLDAIDVREHEILDVPVDTFKEGRVDTAAIDQDQQAIGELAIESANTDSPLVALLARDIDARDEAKKFWDARGAGVADVILSEHGDRCGSLP